MGYESRVFVIDRHDHNTWVYGEELARFDLSKISYDYVDFKRFCDLFVTLIDFNLYNTGNVNENEESDEECRKDRYGEHCKYTDVDTVIAWLEKQKSLPNYVYYRRSELFLDFLYSIKKHEGDYRQVVLVHYGY